MSTKTKPTYRVTAPLIQIQGHVAFTGQQTPYDRHLRHGDIVPDWVPADEVTRLLELGFLEEM